MAGYKEVMAAIVEVRVEQGKTHQTVTDLKDRLYDKDGDIPAIKAQVAATNGSVQDNTKKLIGLPCRAFCKNKKVWITAALIVFGGGGFISKETVVSLIALVRGG